MPQLSVWTVRISLAYLAIGFTIGALLMVHTALSLPLWILQLRAFHIELLLIGWLIQLAIGVAFWILPRSGRQRENTMSATASIILLNLGIWLAAGGQLVWPAASLLPAVGRTFETAAALLFGFHVWTRINPPRRPKH